MKDIIYFLVFVSFVIHGAHCISAKLSINLQKSGFHRILKYATIFTEPLETPCDYFLEQTLPASVYISSDQLDSLQRLDKINYITPTSIDIETITEKSEPFKIYLYGHTASLFTISLPIHFRYHMPGNTSFVRISIDRPKLFVNCGTARIISTVTNSSAAGQLNNMIKFRCKNSEKSICRWQQLDYDIISNDIKVSIPIGYKDFNSIVVFVTLLISWVASYYTIVAICEKSTALKKRM